MHTRSAQIDQLILTFILSVAANNLVEPVLQIRTLCSQILNDDLSYQIQVETACSKDMKILFEAFSGMLIALRFGSDSYVAGDIKRAKTVFQDALNLYQHLNNARGVGIACNNLVSGAFLLCLVLISSLLSSILQFII
jgi:hypothetical protein